MRLCCPRCGEQFAYDDQQAGKTIACRHCRGPVLVPLPEQLDEASRAAYMAEKQKAEARRQKELQQEQLRLQREAEKKAREEEARQQAAAEAERQRARQGADQAVRQQAAVDRAAADSARAGVLRPVAEEEVVGKRYDGLLSVARTIRFLAWIEEAAAAILLLSAVLVRQQRGDWGLAGVLMAVAAAAAINAALFEAISRVMGLLVDVADDARAIRYLLKRLPEPRE